MTPYGFTFFEYDERGHCLYAIACCKFFVLVNVYFGNACAIAYFAFQFFQYRMHGFARPAPGSKEIN